ELCRGQPTAGRETTPGEPPTNDGGLSGTPGLRFGRSPGVLSRPFPNFPELTWGLQKTLMIADIHKPDISTLLTRGHFYFGWTLIPQKVDNLGSPPYPWQKPVSYLYATASF